MAWRRLRLRREDHCRECGCPLEAGEDAYWDAATRTVACLGCVPEPGPVDPGVAGRSADREHERRRARREERTRLAHPLIGGALLALRGAPAHEEAFRRGAAGERAVAESLEGRLGGGPAVLLHDRRMPGGRGNIDHLAIAPGGVHVIDAKAVRGRVRVALPLIGAPRLLVAGRDRSLLVDGLDRQIAAVRRALGTSDREIPVVGVLCFTEADLPLLGARRIRGHLLAHPRGVAKRLGAEGVLDAETVAAVAHRLAVAFPAA